MSEEVEKRLMVLLHAPEISPYGMPIPGLAGLSAPDEEAANAALLAAPKGTLADLPRLLTLVKDGSTGPFKLIGVPEGVQADGSSVPALAGAGVLTGAAFTAELDEDGWVVIRRVEASSEAEEVRVAPKVAQALCVSTD